MNLNPSASVGAKLTVPPAAAFRSITVRLVVENDVRRPLLHAWEGEVTQKTQPLVVDRISFLVGELRTQAGLLSQQSQE
jgi:hypothetical protein